MFKKLLQISKDLGFVDFGVAKVQKLDEAALKWGRYVNGGNAAEMDYLKRNLDVRANPELLVQGAKTIFVFLAPYSLHNDGSGIASFAYGIDYHAVIKGKLRQFMSLAGIEGRPFTDSAPLLEREWAVRAGLGFIGRNHFLISPKYGLTTLIGAIVSTFPFEEIDCNDFRSKVENMPKKCSECGKCVAACPNNALQGEFLDARRCISFHTIESKKLYEDKPINFAGSIFGCERCIKVCPWHKEISGWPEFESKASLLASLTREDWQNMSEERFKEQFSDSSLLRAGLAKIKNNL